MITIYWSKPTNRGPSQGVDYAGSIPDFLDIAATLIDHGYSYRAVIK